MGQENFTDKARRYVQQSPQTKKLDSYHKDRLIRGIASLVKKAYKAGWVDACDYIKKQIKRT